MPVTLDEGVLVPRSHPVVRELTIEIRSLQRTAARDEAETAVEVGRRLKDVRGVLAHGDWLSWVAEETPFSNETARQRIELAEWAQRRPQDFMRWKSLGTTNLTAISALDHAGLARLRRSDTFTVPGTDVRKDLELFTTRELGALLASWSDEEPEPELEARRLRQGYGRRVRGLVDATARLADEVDLDEDTARAYQQQLLDAASMLAKRYHLD